MKLAILFLAVLGSGILVCAEIPPVPSIAYKEQKKQALRECKIPPQIAILPPQIDVDYRECVNKYYAPNPNTAERNLKNLGLLKEEDKLISIQEAKGFIRAYEFLYETTESKGWFLSKSTKKITKVILCDDTMLNCYRVQQNNEKTKSR